jgi:hypothetical protein
MRGRKKRAEERVRVAATLQTVRKAFSSSLIPYTLLSFGRHSLYHGRLRSDELQRRQADLRLHDGHDRV